MNTSSLDSGALTVLGQRLRQAREAKDITLEQIAETTHIGLGRLKALELGDRANLPETVYIQGFIRKYAQSVDLDYDLLMAEAQAQGPSAAAETTLKNRLKGSQEPEVPSAAKPMPTGTSEASPQAAPWRPFLPKTIYLLLGLLVLGLSLATVILRKPQSPGPASTLTLAPPPPPPTAALKPEPSPSPSSVQQPNNAKAVKAEPPESGLTPALIEAKGPVWLEIWVDGQKQPLEQLKPGQALKLEVKQSLRLYPGRPDLVSVQLGDRRTAPLGPIEQIRWYEFSTQPSQSPGQP